MTEAKTAAEPASTTSHSGLARHLGVMGLAATGICAMLGAAVNVVPFMIQRSVPGIGPYVMQAYFFAAVPAILAAMAYAILASAMPRAGGSYVYASRALSPYLGFVASFSQWFGLSIAIGVVSYVLVPFLRDVAQVLGMVGTAAALDTGSIRVLTALAFLWLFVGVNTRGLRLYQSTLIPMMFLMFALGSVVIVAGFFFNHQDFAVALLQAEGTSPPAAPAAPFDFNAFLAASALLFSSFIGFDAIAQAGGEAKNPSRALPRAIGIAVLTVGTFYLLFTAAVYNAVPWAFIAERAQEQDLTAPGLLGYLLPAGLTVAIIAGAAVALINDLPAMLLAVSRLMFAWAEDGIFPSKVARVHAATQTPRVAIVLSGMMASVGILGCHLAGDFFLGVDILVTAMLINFLLMCVSVLALPYRNAEIAGFIKVVQSRKLQVLIGVAGVVLLGMFLGIHVVKDMTADVDGWYFRSTWLYVGVMVGATLIYLREVTKLRKAGVDVKKIFATLPPE